MKAKTHTYSVSIAEALTWQLPGRSLQDELIIRAEADARTAGVLAADATSEVTVGRGGDKFRVQILTRR